MSSDIPAVRLLFLKNRSGPITAVQDTFGKAYRCFPFGSIGTVMKTGHIPKNNNPGDRDMDLYSLAIAPANMDTIGQLIKRSKHPRRSLRHGAWFEIAPE